MALACHLLREHVRTWPEISRIGKRSEASKVDQSLIISWRALSSASRHMPSSFCLFPSKLNVTVPATRQVSRIFTVGTCARAASAKAAVRPVITPATTAVFAMIGRNRDRAVPACAVEIETILMRVSVVFPRCDPYSANSMWDFDAIGNWI